jgi:hypothetical protein
MMRRKKIRRENMTTANLLDRQDTLTTRKMFDLGDRAAPISIFPSADASTIISAIFSRRVVVGKGKLTSFCCRSKKKNPYGVSPPPPPSIPVCILRFNHPSAKEMLFIVCQSEWARLEGHAISLGASKQQQ